jgi:hypothetical protein
MKVAISSASFGSVFARGELTQLEWLDLCANELEADGIVFDSAHFPREDDEYLAQVKKCSVDLGLTIAAVAADGVLESDGARWLDVAATLGAPLLIAHAPSTSGDPAAWGRFTEALQARAKDAKRVNVTLALRNAPGTLCVDVTDLARATKDVDSAWVRYALDARSLGELRALARTVIAVHTIGDVDRFATDGDEDAATLVRGLARFRGFIVLDAATAQTPVRGAYHRAVERFGTLRAARLSIASS